MVSNKTHSIERKIKFEKLYDELNDSPELPGYDLYSQFKDDDDTNLWNHFLTVVKSNTHMTRLKGVLHEAQI